MFYLLEEKIDNMSSNDGYQSNESEVLELYNQGKSTRDIAKILRMSLRDISLILKKGGVNHGVPIIKDNGNKNNVKATQAYKLFSEGKKLVDVSIQLEIRENEATKYFHEFLRLKGQDEIYEIYLENKHYLRTLRMLLRVLKKEGMAAAIDKIDWFVNMVKLGTYKIPELQNEYAKLKGEVEDIDYKKTMAKHALENMNNQITILRRTISQLSATCNNKRNEIAYLQFGIQELEGYIHGLNNQNQQQEEIQNERYS
jgi:chromosome segregation ATPase